MRSHFWIVLRYSLTSEYEPKLLGGVYQRLSEALDDNVPDDFENIIARDRLFLFERGDERIKVWNPHEIKKGENKHEIDLEFPDK